MTWMPGLMVGVVSLGLTIAFNTDEPNHVAAIPSVWYPLLTAVAAYGVAARYRPAAGELFSVWRTALVGASIAGAGMMLFTWWYLPLHSVRLASVSGVGTFAVTLVIVSLTMQSQRRTQT